MEPQNISYRTVSRATEVQPTRAESAKEATVNTYFTHKVQYTNFETIFIATLVIQLAIIHLKIQYDNHY